MKKKRLFLFVQIVLTVLVIVFAIPGHAYAANPDTVNPAASHYLTSYSAYVYPAGSGKIQVYYDVTGTHTMENIGALSVEIYESTDNSSWSWVKSFTSRDTAGMLANNTRFYGNHVDYQGVAGRYYKAYVCVWAGRNGDGDTRYFWTDSRRAK